uniref:PUB domain-containing protein n=1 Tax=Phaeomonas parva TaxID=124430 RepID=A0A7S1TWN1_9STRA
MSAFRRCAAALEKAEASAANWPEDLEIGAYDEVRNAHADLVEEAARFRARLAEVDPVTNEPRYGPNMKAKVEDWIARYEQLGDALDTHAAAADARRAEAAVLDAEASAAAAAAAEAQCAEAEAAHRARLAQTEEELARSRFGAQKFRDEDTPEPGADDAETRAALSAEAAAAKEERLAAEAAAAAEAEKRRTEREAARRAWQANAGSGVDAFKSHLADFAAAARADGGIAAPLRALHVVISNASRRPEAEAYKVLRCRNANFHRDLGQHDAARCCLAAVGYRLMVRREDPVEGVEEEPDEAELEAFQMAEPNPEVILGPLAEPAPAPPTRSA